MYMVENHASHRAAWFDPLQLIATLLPQLNIDIDNSDHFPYHYFFPTTKFRSASMHQTHTSYFETGNFTLLYKPSLSISDARFAPLVVNVDAKTTIHNTVDCTPELLRLVEWTSPLYALPDLLYTPSMYLSRNGDAMACMTIDLPKFSSK